MELSLKIYLFGNLVRNLYRENIYWGWVQGVCLAKDYTKVQYCESMFVIFSW